MRATVGQLGIALAIATLVAGCSSGDPHLMRLRSDKQGPDEFSILPSKPLQMPADIAALPTPTPGGSNITDPTPFADAAIALGGKPPVATGAVPAADGALVAAADRYGQDAAIRSRLATEDYDWRKRHDGRLLERMFGLNVYYKAYAPMSLNQSDEVERWRKAGVPTPDAPPSYGAEKALP